MPAGSLFGMSPVSCSCGSVRPAAVVNAEIRALVAGVGQWTPEALAEYRRLIAEERAAVAREATLAA